MQKKPRRPTLLRRRVLAEAARVVAEVLRAGRLDAGEDAHGAAQGRRNARIYTDAARDDDSRRPGPRRPGGSYRGAAAAGVARRRRASRAALRAAAQRCPPLVFAGEARAGARRARRGAGGPRVPAPGGRLRRVVPRLRAADRDGAAYSAVRPRTAEDPAADVRRAHLRRRAAGGEGRPDRRPVRQAALGAASSASATARCPSFRGHMVHDDEPTAEARIPDPLRMLEGYNQSTATLNLCARSRRAASPT